KGKANDCDERCCWLFRPLIVVGSDRAKTRAWRGGGEDAVRAMFLGPAGGGPELDDAEQQRLERWANGMPRDDPGWAELDKLEPGSKAWWKLQDSLTAKAVRTEPTCAEKYYYNLHYRRPCSQAEKEKAY